MRVVLHSRAQRGRCIFKEWVAEAEMRIAMQQYDLAQNALETHLVLHPRDMKAYYTLAEMYVARGMFQQARQAVAVLNRLMQTADPILPLVDATRALQTRLDLEPAS